MMLKSSYLILLSALLLAACAPAWQKPGATADDFEVAQKLCADRANVRFPPVQRQIMHPAYTTPSHVGCFNSPVLTDCLQSQSVFMPPSFEIVDDNKDKRNQDIKTCLMQNGWHQVDE